MTSILMNNYFLHKLIELMLTNMTEMNEQLISMELHM